jgi:hypothetical protein
MAATGQGGILGFGPQHDKEVAVGPSASPNVSQSRGHQPGSPG